MVKELIYTGEVKDGILKITNRKGFDSDLRGFEGGKVTIKLSKYRKSRSNKQNAYYWGNFIPCQIECFLERWGETYRADQVHEWNKINFFGTEHVIEATGELVMAPGSSSAQTTVEFEECLEKCRQWFRQNMEWEIPLPNEQSKIDF